MPKATIEFNLPEEEIDFKQAKDGYKWESVVWDVEQQLRKWTKYGHEFKNVEEALMAARKLVWDAMDEYEVDFNA